MTGGRTGLPSWLNPVWLVVASILSVQLGAAFAKGLFTAVAPTAIAWLRMLVASIIFLVVARPRFGGRGWPEWRVALGYGTALGLMNWSIYQSFARIPIGLAVTIEFLGPLSLAVLGSRKLKDLLWVVLAGLGVVLLGVAPVTIDWVGVGFALLAGAGWAGYIVLSGPTGRVWSGITGVTVGSLVGAAMFAVPGLVAGGSGLWQPWVLAVGLAVGVLSSVIPYGLEMVALRTIPPGIFGILMSLEPAVAALSALVVLGETLSLVEIAAMACVVVASVGATRGLGTSVAEA